MATFNILVMLFVIVSYIPNTIGILMTSSSPTEKLLNKKILKIIWLVTSMVWTIPNIIYYFTSS